MSEARKWLPWIELAPGNYEALEGADALVVVTEWNEYRHPDFQRIKNTLRRPVIIDGRNLYSLSRMKEFGFVYHSIGRPEVL
jgi:UDPglucose 6-dehydrogenase